MKILFKKLQITDISEKISKTVILSDGDNLITSLSNSAGKSVIMKSFYHCLGADANFDDNFKNKPVLFKLDLSVKNDNYSVLRLNNSFAITKNGSLCELIGQGERTKLSEFYEKEFNFSIYLINRNKKIELAPPAYMFVPYYMDQDRSWKNDQWPFSQASEGQYLLKDRNELYYFHLGVYTNDYTSAKITLDKTKKDLEECKSKLEAQDKAYQDVKKVFDSYEIITNSDELESLYRNSSKQMNQLISEQRNLIELMLEKDRERIDHLVSIKNNKKIISNLKKNIDNNYSPVECPNCNLHSI